MDILLTGFPSFVARRLFLTIRERAPEATVRLLVRPDYVDEARRRLEEMELDDEHTLVLSGDVVAMDLGLSGREYLEVIANVTDVFHVASDLVAWRRIREQTSRGQRASGRRTCMDAAQEMRNLRRLQSTSPRPSSPATARASLWRTI